MMVIVIKKERSECDNTFSLKALVGNLTVNNTVLVFFPPKEYSPERIHRIHKKFNHLTVKNTVKQTL
jgi:hypothetical protein